MAEHPNEELRQRIEAALKSRAAEAEVRIRPETNDRYGRQDPFAIATWNAVEFFASGETEADALRELAKAAGLDADGNDPADAIRRESLDLSSIATRLGYDPNVEYDDLVGTVSEGVDFALQREEECLAEIERLTRQLADVRAAREDALDAAFNDGVNAMKALAIKACNVVSDTHGTDPKRQRWPAQVGALDARATIKAWPVPKRGEPIVEEDES